MICTNDPDHGAAIADLTSTPYIPDLDSCISRVGAAGKLLGGVIFQNYQLRSVVLHVASWGPNWLSADILWMIFDYAFNQLGVEKVLGFVPSNNEKALQFDLKVGFQEETRIKDVVPGGDLVVLYMYRKNCRWLDRIPRSIKIPLAAELEKELAQGIA